MKKYQPINCNYYDFLLELSTFKIHSIIRYTNKFNKTESTEGLILDIYTKNGSEFIAINTNVNIQLDHIISINGKKNNENSCVINSLQI